MNHESATFTPDQLIAGESDLVSKPIILKAGQNLTRGAVLGKTTTAGTLTGTAASGNTGNGTIGSLTVNGSTKAGTYRAICTATASNSGTFKVIDPNGNFLGTATVGTAFSTEINFTIADGSTDFALNDMFYITATDLTQKHLLSVTTATDGSQYPDCVLAEDTNATSADVSTIAYIEGSFSANHITLGAGHSIASVREQFRTKDIHIINTTA